MSHESEVKQHEIIPAAPAAVATAEVVGDHDVMSIEQAQAHFTRFRQFVGAQLKEKVDFGTVGGGKKPGLWRPGAEKIMQYFGLGAKIRHTGETVIDWKQPFFHYACEADVFNRRTGKIIATAQGSANSLEDKFRWQWVSENKVPKGLKVDQLESEERQYEGRKYTVYRIPVNDPFGQVNNIDKRAGKRALVAAVLIACAASDFFSPEDDDEEEGSRGAGGSSGGSKAASASGYVEKDAISEGKLRRLHAVRNEAKVSEAQLQAHLREKYAYTVDEEGAAHASRISWKHLDTIIAWMEAQKGTKQA